MERFYQGGYHLAIERAFCKGCGLCVHSCPVGILFLDGLGKIAVREIDQCIFCGICEARCPDFAIWVVKSPEREGEAIK